MEGLVKTATQVVCIFLLFFSCICPNQHLLQLYNMVLRLSWLLSLSVWGQAGGDRGVDTSTWGVAWSESDFACLKEEGNAFVIIEAFRRSSSVLVEARQTGTGNSLASSRARAPTCARIRRGAATAAAAPASRPHAPTESQPWLTPHPTARCQWSMPGKPALVMCSCITFRTKRRTPRCR